MRKNLIFPVLGLLFVLVGALGSWETYHVWDLASADLLWHSGEAYLFVGVSRSGYRFTYLEYLIEFAKEYFYMVPPRDNRTFYTTVFRITSSNVQRYTVDGMAFDLYVPLDDGIYSRRDGAFWKWMGNRFDKASVGDQRRLQGVNDRDFTDIQGWSKRKSLTEMRPYSDVTIQFDGQPVTISTTAGSREVSIDISRSGQSTERVFDLDQRLNRVSKSEYEKIFGKL